MLRLFTSKLVIILCLSICSKMENAKMINKYIHLVHRFQNNIHWSMSLRGTK